VDRRRHVQRDLLVDRGDGHLLRRADGPASGVGVDDIDPTEIGERALDRVVQRLGVGDVEGSRPQPVAEAVGEVGQDLGAAGGCRDAVAALQQTFGDDASDASRRPRDEPVGCGKSAWVCELGRCGSPAAGMMVNYGRTPALPDLRPDVQLAGPAGCIITTADTYTSVLPETAHQAAQATADMILDIARTVPGSTRHLAAVPHTAAEVAASGYYQK
jgi:hypothetical protein